MTSEARQAPPGHRFRRRRVGRFGVVTALLLGWVATTSWAQQQDPASKSADEADKDEKAQVQLNIDTPLNTRVRRSAASAYRKAKEQLGQKNYDEARKLMNRALAHHPVSGVYGAGKQAQPYFPHYMLGLIHLELAEYDKAAVEFFEEEKQGQIQYDPALYQQMLRHMVKLLSTTSQNAPRDTTR